VRSSDDGEPGGTAGPPILRRIESSGLDRVVVVVTRYYGGTNLGTGGLIRAYGAAAKAGLDAVPVETGHATVTLLIDHPYDLSAPVGGVLSAHAAETLEATYEMDVRLRVAVREEAVEDFAAALREATGGRVTVERAEPPAD
jgi:putative IMPACT (imprinted ancient) family translation regulator